MASGKSPQKFWKSKGTLGKNKWTACQKFSVKLVLPSRLSPDCPTSVKVTCTMTTTCWMMLSLSSSQCKPVWSKAPQSNPRSSLWKRILNYGYLKGGNFGIAMLNKYHVRNLKAKIIMYFFVVWLGGGERLFFKWTPQLSISFLPALKPTLHSAIQ